MPQFAVGRRDIAAVAPLAFRRNFTSDNLAWAQKKIAEYPAGRQQSAVIPLLWRAQEQQGWISRAVLARGQRSLALTPAGTALLGSLVTGMEQMQATLLGGLEPGEREELLRLLRKFVEPDSRKRQGR